MDNIEIGILNDQIKQESSFLDLIKEEVGKNIIGQKYMTDRLLLALLCQGHILS